MMLRAGFIAGLAAVLANSAVAGDSDAYSRFDRKWVESMSASPVTGRLANALGQGGGEARDDVCGCLVSSSGGILDPAHCPVVYRTGDEGKAKVVAIAIVTPADWGANLACYRNGDARCKSGDGLSYKGDTCCSRVDQDYSRARGDLNLYLLVPGPVAERISALSLGEAGGGAPIFSDCSILVDEVRGKWSLSAGSAGFLARVWLYAAAHYGAQTPAALGVLRKISEAYPPGDAEIARARAIGRAQGGKLNGEVVR